MEGKTAANSIGSVQSLGAAVGRGFSWLTASLLVGKLCGAVAQLALGRWISDEQFRDFAIVASVAAIVKVFQDGGVPQVLIQRGRDDFNRLLGPVFWLSLAIGIAGGVVLAAAAPFIARSYGTPSLAAYLWIVALTLPLGAPATVLRAWLRVDLRFKAVAIIAVFWFMLRQLSAVGFAAAGLGVTGLVLPLLLVALFEWAATYYATRLQPWRRPAEVGQWSELLRNSVYVVAVAISRGLARTGDYLVLGLLAPAGVVGKYFFGYQITTQVVELLATNLQHVLFPALSRLANDPSRQSQAIERTVRMLVFVAAPISLGLAVSVDPMVRILDATIWKHKWSSTIPLMQVFAVAAPLRMFTDVLNASLASRGQFRNSALLTLAEGLWLMASSAVAYLIVGANLAGLAALIAAGQIAFSLSASSLTLPRFGIAPRSFLAAVIPAYLTALGSAGAAVGLLALLPQDAGNIARLVLAIGLFGAIYAIIARTVLRRDINELVRVMPAPIGRAVRWAFLLPSAVAG